MAKLLAMMMMTMMMNLPWEVVPVVVMRMRMEVRVWRASRSRGAVVLVVVSRWSAGGARLCWQFCLLVAYL